MLANLTSVFWAGFILTAIVYVLLDAVIFP
jgi:hypothetical protein